MMDTNERRQFVAKAKQLLDLAEDEKRDLTPEEQREFEELTNKLKVEKNTTEKCGLRSSMSIPLGGVILFVACVIEIGNADAMHRDRSFSNLAFVTVVVLLTTVVCFAWERSRFTQTAWSWTRACASFLVVGIPTFFAIIWVRNLLGL